VHSDFILSQSLSVCTLQSHFHTILSLLHLYCVLILTQSACMISPSSFLRLRHLHPVLSCLTNPRLSWRRLFFLLCLLFLILALVSISVYRKQTFNFHLLPVWSWKCSSEIFLFMLKSRLEVSFSIWWSDAVQDEFCISRVSFISVNERVRRTQTFVKPLTPT